MSEKIYIPYDYRTMMRGYIEIDLDGKDKQKMYEDIRSGEVNPSNVGKMLDAEQIMKYDENIDSSSILSEEEYKQDKELKNNVNTKGYSPNVTRREA